MMTATKHRAILLSALVVSLLVSAAPSFAQDLGDAARQERERKQNLTQHSAHVYTNEDLKRAQILVPEDKERVLAARRNAKTPEVQAAANPNSAPAIPSVKPSKKFDTLDLPLPVVKFPVAAPLADVSRDTSSLAPAMKIRKTKKLRPETNDFIFGDIQKKQSLPVPAERKLDLIPSKGLRVAPGDSLWKIADRVLGNGARWRELAALNPEISDPNLIHTGEWIRVSANDGSNGKQIVVRAGDTLSSVAQAELGNARAFTCIAQANPQLQSIDLIYPGQTLVVPQACTVAR
jgi:nucleoid-associated protein YgaU